MTLTPHSPAFYWTLLEIYLFCFVVYYFTPTVITVTTIATEATMTSRLTIIAQIYLQITFNTIFKNITTKYI